MSTKSDTHFREDPALPLASASAAVLGEDHSLVSCILEPICLDQFMFSTCPHADVPCLRHRYESMADGEGERAYGPAEWRSIKSVDPISVVQMIEEIRSRESLSRH